MDISIKTIPIEDQRYPTQGDWFERDGVLNIRISADGHEQFLYAIHEMVEWYLCRERGITEVSVDAFDMAFKGTGEPGDAERSPYRLEHRQAMIVEHLIANFLGLTGYGKVE